MAENNPNPNPNPNPTPPVVTPPASTPPAPTDWTASLSPETKGFVKERGFKDPGEVVEQYRNLEKLRGVPADKLLRTPDSYTDEKERQAALDNIYDRLGRPKTAKDYAIEVPKEGGDAKQAEWAQDLFHKAGLTKSQAEAISKGWNERQGTLTKAQQDAKNLTAQQDVDKMKTEWGAAYEDNLKLVDAGANALGWTKERIETMKNTLGVAETLKMLHDTGRKVGESPFILGDKNPAGGGKLTPEMAQVKIKELMKTSDFTQKLNSGDPETIKYWTNLHEQAFQGHTGVYI